MTVGKRATPARGLSAHVLLYAARYALGRRTSAPHDVEEAIAANLDAFKRDAGSREALIDDITRAREANGLGDAMDRESWTRTQGRLIAARGSRSVRPEAADRRMFTPNSSPGSAQKGAPDGDSSDV